MFNRVFLSLLLLCATVSVNIASAAPLITRKSIAFILTGHGTLGETGKSTGFYVPEAAHPWKVLTEAGHQVIFASPKGGPVPHDGLDLQDPVVSEFWNKPSIKEALQETLPISELAADELKAIVVVGGHGTMWDLAKLPELQELIAAHYELGGYVAAVCHGPVALLEVMLSDGTPLVKGKKVAAFSNQEETKVQLQEVVPFLLEDALLEKGAMIQKAPNFQPSVVADGRLITGQNPASAQGMAEALAAALNQTS